MAIRHTSGDARRFCALADRLATAPVDGQSGRYTYLRIYQEAADTTVTDGRASTVMVTTEDHRWRASDGSGQQVYVRYPAGIPVGKRPKPVTDRHGPGELAGVVAEPLPTDPDTLRQQFHRHQPPGLGPAALIRAWADVNDWHIPAQAARAAAIRLWCRTPGLRLGGTGSDRAGRTGITVSVDTTDENGATRDVILLDPRTGEVLASETVVLRDPGGLGITAPTILAHRAVLARARVNTMRRP